MKVKRAAKKNTLSKPLVGIIMGSDSDLSVMQAASDILKRFGIAHEIEIVSAHRTPQKMYSYAQTAISRGLKVIIAGAGGAAHLPGMVASLTPLPVIGVPVQSGRLKGLDSLLSIAQMPKGVPVACVGVDNATNAGLLSVRILGCHTPALQKKMLQFLTEQEKKVKTANVKLHNLKGPSKK